MVRFVAESMGLERPGRARRVIGVVLRLGAVGALSLALVYWCFGKLLADRLFHAPSLAAITGLVAVWIVVMVMQMILAETFRGFHDIHLATLFKDLLMAIVMTVGLGLLWFLRGEATLPAIVLLATGSGLVSVSLAGWVLRRRLVAITSRDPKDQTVFNEVLSAAWPLLISNLTLFALGQVGLWVMGAARPQGEVALYGAAERAVTLVLMPLVVVDAVVSPIIAEKYAQGSREELERTLRSTAAIAAVPAFMALVGFIFLGGPLLGLVYGDYYRRGAAALALLCVGQFVTVWAGSCKFTLIMTGHQKVLMLISVLSSIVAVAAALGTVGRFGILGVAASSSMGIIIQTVLMLAAVKYMTGMWTHVRLKGFSHLLRRAHKNDD